MIAKNIKAIAQIDIKEEIARLVAEGREVTPEAIVENEKIVQNSVLVKDDEEDTGMIFFGCTVEDFDNITEILKWSDYPAETFCVVNGIYIDGIYTPEELSEL